MFMFFFTNICAVCCKSIYGSLCEKERENKYIDIVVRFWLRGGAFLVVMQCRVHTHALRLNINFLANTPQLYVSVPLSGSLCKKNPRGRFTSFSDAICFVCGTIEKGSSIHLCSRSLPLSMKCNLFRVSQNSVDHINTCSVFDPRMWFTFQSDVVCSPQHESAKKLSEPIR
ncbi:hypothetical protein VPH35_082465 [Triticum aestivum]